jgi:predicted histone-like DNA-binding protein
MAVNYKIYKSNRKGTGNGMFYARASHRGTSTVNDLAKTMESNSTVKRSDILAVLSELSETMRSELNQGNRVKIDGLGTFKVGINTSPAKTAKEFTAQKNIKRIHLIFLPEVTSDAQGKQVKTLLQGVKVQEASEYAVDEEEEAGE